MLVFFLVIGIVVEVRGLKVVRVYSFRNVIVGKTVVLVYCVSVLC